MGTITDIINRVPRPGPWSEGEKIPWNEPGFSRRMLQEHLSQAHDAASRRFATIDRHVAWIHDRVLGGEPGKVLDLGCGPGLYAGRLAQRGHACRGIDFSPASIDYARAEAERENLACSYVLEDLRRADYGDGYDLVMLIYGEFNVFRPEDARLILRKARRALVKGGMLLLEPHTFDAVEEMGKAPNAWYSAQSGLFAEGPYLVLMENFWDAESHVATKRYFVIDGATGDVSRHAESMQAYTDDEYRQLLSESGFTGVTFYPSMTGEATDDSRSLLAIVGTAIS